MTSRRLMCDGVRNCPHFPGDLLSDETQCAHAHNITSGLLYWNLPFIFICLILTIIFLSLICLAFKFLFYKLSKNKKRERRENRELENRLRLEPSAPSLSGCDISRYDGCDGDCGTCDMITPPPSYDQVMKIK